MVAKVGDRRSEALTGDHGLSNGQPDGVVGYQAVAVAPEKRRRQKRGRCCGGATLAPKARKNAVDVDCVEAAGEVATAAEAELPGTELPCTVRRRRREAISGIFINVSTLERETT